MPHATPIPALANAVAPMRAAPGAANEKIAAASQQFGDLFREKAAAIQAPLSGVTPSGVAPETAKSPKGSNPVTPDQEVASANNTEPPLTQQAQQTQQLGLRTPHPPRALTGPASASAAQLRSAARIPEDEAVASTVESKIEPDSVSASLSEKSGASHAPQIKPSAHKTAESSKTGNQNPQGALTPVLETQLPALSAVSMPASSTPQTTTTASDANGAMHDRSPVSAPEAGGKSPAASSTSSSTATGANEPVPATLAATLPAKDSTEPSPSAPHATHGSTEPAAAPAVATASLSASPLDAHPESASVSTPPPAQTNPSSAATPAMTAASVPNAEVNAYDRIDQGPAPVVLHSGAQHVAVGVQDPGLGWVEIKAQSAAGHVDATLVAGSPQSHSSLSAQLPAMAQYLEERNLRVSTLSVHQQTHDASRDANSGASQNSARENGTGGNGGTPQSPRPSENSGSSTRYSGVPSGSASPEFAGESSFRPVSYISVHA
jgi:hypothetical protein